MWPSVSLFFTQSPCPCVLMSFWYWPHILQAFWMLPFTRASPFNCLSVTQMSSTTFSVTLPPLLKLSCSDTRINEVVIFAFASFNELSCLLIILISYLYILIAILKIHSAEGRHKAFSTCASHLMTITIFFGTILFMYLRPRSSYSMDQDKVVSVFYTVVIPMLNPLIYSLRNKEVKASLGKIFKTTHSSVLRINKVWYFRT